MDARGRLVARAAGCAEDMLLIDTKSLPQPLLGDPFPAETEELGKALCLGIRDYATKCGFSSVLVGLSGGIDSALVAALAVCALGRERVTGVSMPSLYSSAGSVTDAEALARNLGIRLSAFRSRRSSTPSAVLRKRLRRGRQRGLAEQTIAHSRHVAHGAQQ